MKGTSAHIHARHVVEYGGDSGIIGAWGDAIRAFLAHHGVRVHETQGGDSAEWEVSKNGLSSIPDEAYWEWNWPEWLSSERVRQFVRELADAPTGGSAFVSWF